MHGKRCGFDSYWIPGDDKFFQMVWMIINRSQTGKIGTAEMFGGQQENVKL